MSSTNVRRIVAAAVAATAVVTVTAACGRGGDSGSGSGASAGPRIAIVTRNFTNPYWAALRDGALAEGQALGVEVNVQAGTSETDSDGENSKISTLAGQGYDCFGVVPVNDTNVITPLVPVARKQVPIINIDSAVDPVASQAAGVSYASFIGSNNVDAGKLAGQKMMAALGGQGKVAILQGIAGEQNGVNREKGFTEATGTALQVVQKAPADYETDKGLQVAEAILKAHPDITGIFAANDNMGLGAVQAIKNAGLSGKIKVISVDGIRDALDSVKRGELTGTVTQYPYAMGQLAIQACTAVHQKKPVPSTVTSPIAYIDSSVVDQQIASFPKPFQPFDNPLTAVVGG